MVDLVMAGVVGGGEEEEEGGRRLSMALHATEGSGRRRRRRHQGRSLAQTCLPRPSPRSTARHHSFLASASIIYYA